VIRYGRLRRCYEFFEAASKAFPIVFEVRKKQVPPYKPQIAEMRRNGQFHWRSAPRGISEDRR
jgi:hypothetical protein